MSLEERVRVRTQVHAALTIQRAFRLWKARRAERREAMQARLSGAQMGQALVLASMESLRVSHDASEWLTPR